MSNCLVMSSSCPPSACIHVTSHLRDQTLTQVDYPTEIRPSPSWTSSRNFLWARLKAKVPVKTGLLCSLVACRCSSVTIPTVAPFASQLTFDLDLIQLVPFGVVQEPFPNDTSAVVDQISF